MYILNCQNFNFWYFDFPLNIRRSSTVSNHSKEIYMWLKKGTLMIRNIRQSESKSVQVRNYYYLSLCIYIHLCVCVCVCVCVRVCVLRTHVCIILTTPKVGHTFRFLQVSYHFFDYVTKSYDVVLSLYQTNQIAQYHFITDI